jgi:CRISPR-associated protein Cas2
VSRDAPRRYLIAYDIVDERRRAHVAARLQSFGDRVQYSVFVVDARPAKIVRLKAALAQCLELSEDSLLICDLGTLSVDVDRRLEVIGKRRKLTEARGLVI